MGGSLVEFFISKHPFTFCYHCISTACKQVMSSRPVAHFNMIVAKTDRGRSDLKVYTSQYLCRCGKHYIFSCSAG